MHSVHEAPRKRGAHSQVALARPWLTTWPLAGSHSLHGAQKAPLDPTHVVRHMPLAPSQLEQLKFSAWEARVVVGSNDGGTPLT